MHYFGLCDLHPGNRSTRNGKEMTFTTEMDLFFARNCYFDKDRARVKAWPAYQLAEQKADITLAQEIATRVLETGLDRVQKQ
jgi:hypothetical protein